MHRGLWNFIALFSGTVAIISGIMSLLAAGIGVQVYIPDIVIGGFAYKVDLIQIGQYAAFAYVIGQLIQALTPTGDIGFERYAKIGSWVALIMFGVTLAIMCVQLGVDRGNVRELMRTSSPFQLMIVLFAFALIDVFLLPWLKHFIHGTPGYGNLVHTSEVVETEPLRGQSLVNRVAPLIHAPGARINYFDCRGKDIRVIPSAVEGGEPEVHVIEPHAA